MRRNRLQVVLLCEDRQQERFLGGVLKSMPHIRLIVRVLVAPRGRGDAKEWICKQYPGEVKAYRAQANHLGNGLVVTIDGDNEGGGVRKRELDEKLEANAMPRRASEERIAIVVPTWSIETWLWYLCGQSGVREDDAYKDTSAYRLAQRAGEVTIGKAVVAFLSGPLPVEPPSLADGRRELERLKP